MLSIPRSTDVFVVGGGPAGLATAIASRLKGLDVTVVDPAQPPIDKACGEGLMPDSLTALELLGISIGPDQSYPFRGIRFVHESVSVGADFPIRRGLGIRRVTLHQTMLDRARQLGVRMLWGQRVTGIGQGFASISGEETSCRWVVGADGLSSRVRCWAGLESTHYESRRFGFRRHYRVAPWSDHMEIHWTDGYQIYLTPVSRDHVCVALITRDPRQRLDDALQAFPDLAGKLNGTAVTAERGAITVSRRLHQVCRGSTVLVGDASGSVDAITGEGLCLSFRQALALADALATGDLSSYESAHSRLFWRPAFMARLMLLLDQSSSLRRRAIRALSSKPEIFANLVAMHVGESSFADFLSGAMLPLSWRMLTA